MPDSRSVDIAIVGAGASGTMVAFQIVRQSHAAGLPMPSVVLIDPADQPGRGVAYATTRPEHLLNVIAASMSILPTEPNHFVDWLREQGENPAGLADRFVPRRVYGDYLRVQLQEAIAAGVHLRRDRVVAVESGMARRVFFADGSHLEAGAVVLAIGNSPHGVSTPHQGVDVIEAWDDVALGQICADDDIAIVGAGLSMVDAVLTLAANRHRGRIDVFSRHGLAPLAHDAGHDKAEIDIDQFASLPLRARVHYLRRWIADHPSSAWQSMMRTLRGPGQRLWQSLDSDDQGRFLRHVVRFWDIHRHRIAPQVAQTLSALRSGGRLTLHAGRPNSLRTINSRIEVMYVARHQTAQQLLKCDRIVNATGLETHLESTSNPLLKSLFLNGQVRSGPHGRGLDTAADGSVLDRNGEAQSNLYTLGSPRIGSLWESIAIPDLRVQAEELASLLLRHRESRRG